MPGWVSANVWRKAEVDGMVVFSNASRGRTDRLVDELRNADAAFRRLFPELRGDSMTPLRVVVCNDSKSMDWIVPLHDGKPGVYGGLFSRDREGAFMLVNASYGFGAARHAVYHEYIHFLTMDRGVYMPVWLAEGLAELFATVETKKGGRVLVGKALPERRRVVQEERLMSMERFFGVTRVSPEYTSGEHGRGLFYAQSWLLLHFLFQAPEALNPGAKEALMALAKERPYFSERVFEATVGVDYDGIERLLERYASRGRYTVRTLELLDAEERSPVALTEMSEGEVSLLMGSIRLHTRGPGDSLREIHRAYEALPDSPDAAAYRGYYALARDDFAFASKYLGEAIERGSSSPATRVNFAHAVMLARNPLNDLGPRRYDEETTRAVLSALHEARALAGSFSPELYHRFGEILLGTRRDTDLEDFSVLFEGAEMYPSDERIALYLALGLERLGEFESALEVVEKRPEEGSNGQARRLLEKVKLRIEEQLSKGK